MNSFTLPITLTPVTKSNEWKRKFSTNYASNSIGQQGTTHTAIENLDYFSFQSSISSSLFVHMQCWRRTTRHRQVSHRHGLARRLVHQSSAVVSRCERNLHRTLSSQFDSTGNIRTMLAR